MTETVNRSEHQQVFALPHQDWAGVKQRLEWCRETFGERHWRGSWTYNAVYNDVVIQGETNCMLYALRWL